MALILLDGHRRIHLLHLGRCLVLLLSFDRLGDTLGAGIARVCGFDVDRDIFTSCLFVGRFGDLQLCFFNPCQNKIQNK